MEGHCLQELSYSIRTKLLLSTSAQEVTVWSRGREGGVVTDGLSHPSWKSRGRTPSGSLGDPLLALKRNFLGEWQEADVGKRTKEDELFRDSPPKNPWGLHLA